MYMLLSILCISGLNLLLGLDSFHLEKANLIFQAYSVNFLF